MPELSGIELAERLKRGKPPVPSIIFVTAHGQHATTAFEKHAVDYVLKPFSDERIHDALHTAALRTQTERAARLMELLPQLEKLVTKPSRIAIKTKGSILFIDPADVAVIEAQGNYVLLERLSASYLLRESISTFPRKLQPSRFIQIHPPQFINTS